MQDRLVVQHEGTRGAGADHTVLLLGRETDRDAEMQRGRERDREAERQRQKERKKKKESESETETETETESQRKSTHRSCPQQTHLAGSPSAVSGVVDFGGAEQGPAEST